MTKLSTSKPLPKLTSKQRAFVRELINKPKQSATKAVEATYNVNSNVVARSIASENLTKPNILAHLREASDEAEQRVIALMRQEHDKRLSFDASRDVLDRVHGKATQRVESVSTAVVISIDMTGQ